jgi:hypothetical protein
VPYIWWFSREQLRLKKVVKRVNQRPESPAKKGV